MNTLLIISAIILINNLIDAEKLKLVLVKDMPVEDCDEYPSETRIQNFFDMSNLTFNRIEEDVMVANGDIIYKGHLFHKEHPTQGKIQYFIHKFGEWLPISIGVFEEDLCKANCVTRIWGDLLKNFKGKKQCPLVAGDKYSINQYTLFADCIDINFSVIELGLFKAVTTMQFSNDGKSTLACFQVIYQIQTC